MFALIGCKTCKTTGEYTRARGDKVPCKSCKGTGVYQMVEIPESNKNIPHGANVLINVNGKMKMAKAYDPIADILTSA